LSGWKKGRSGFGNMQQNEKPGKFLKLSRLFMYE
jgi:hypothetical protein